MRERRNSMDSPITCYNESVSKKSSIQNVHSSNFKISKLFSELNLPFIRHFLSRPRGGPTKGKSRKCCKYTNEMRTLYLTL